MAQHHWHRGEVGLSRARARAVRLVLLGMGVTVALALGACGASGGTSPGTSTTVTRSTPTTSSTAVTGPGTSTPAAARPVYLFSRVEYPLQIEVNQGDSITLTLAPTGDILTTAPAAGNGVATVGAPIPLPTDLENYQDVGASVETQANGDGPVIWALISPQRQTLLTPLVGGGPRQYLDHVTFTWQVRAVAAGQNTARIVLQLYFVYLDGSEHDGTIEVSQAPIPMVAVAPTPLNTTLPPLKLPLTGLTWLASLFAVIRFLYGAYKTINDVTEPVRDAAKVAGAIHARMGGGDQSTTAQYPRGQQATSPYATPPSGAARHQPPRPITSDPADWPTLRQPRLPGTQHPWPPTPGTGEAPRS